MGFSHDIIIYKNMTIHQAKQKTATMLEDKEIYGNHSKCKAVLQDGSASFAYMVLIT